SIPAADQLLPDLAVYTQRFESSIAGGPNLPAGSAGMAAAQLLGTAQRLNFCLEPVLILPPPPDLAYRPVRVTGECSAEGDMAMPDEAITARDLARRSPAAVKVKDRVEWLSLWAPDAVVQDPVGPSPFDPEGNGHRGPEAIAAFYDKVIAPNELITFEIEHSYLCGNEVADVGVIRTVLPGGKHVAV